MKITLDYIAKEAGVSKATVSNVLNRCGSVSATKREEILAIMDKHDYKPTKRKNVRRKEIPGIGTGTVAVLFPYSPSRMYAGWGSEYVSSILSGVEEALSQSSISLTVAGMGESGELPDCIRDGSVSGVIVASHQQLPSLNVPVVGVFSPLASPDHDLVVSDHEALGIAAAHHLQSAGCRTCAFVNPHSHHAGFALRKRGFTETLQDDDSDALAFESDDGGNPSTIEALVRNVLDHDKDIDGIFIPGSDSNVAAIAMELAKQSGKPLAGLTVVSSVSNIDLLGPMNLGIDYIDIRLQDIGSTAATTLLWRIQNPTAAYRKIMIQPQALEQGDRLQ